MNLGILLMLLWLGLLAVAIGALVESGKLDVFDDYDGDCG